MTFEIDEVVRVIINGLWYSARVINSDISRAEVFLRTEFGDRWFKTSAVDQVSHDYN